MGLIIKSVVPIEGVRGSSSTKENMESEIYHRGFEDGLRVGKKEMSKLREKLISVIQDILNKRQNILESAEAVVLKIVSVVARKVIYKEVETDSEIILKVVKEALSGIIDRSKIVLKVNPLDIELVRGSREEWSNLLEGTSNLEIVSDKEVERGGCLIDTASHEIDARIESKLKRIDEILSVK